MRAGRLLAAVKEAPRLRHPAVQLVKVLHPISRMRRRRSESRLQISSLRSAARRPMSRRQPRRSASPSTH